MAVSEGSGEKFGLNQREQGLDCVRLKEWYQYIFSVSLKFVGYYITGQWGEFIKKMLLIAFIYFFGIYVVFHHKNCFYHFHSF